MKILDDIKSKREAATPGPWKAGYWSGQCHMDHAHGRGKCKYAYKFVDPDEYYGWQSICMADEPIQHITTTEEYGALSRGDSAYIARMDPRTVEAMENVILAAIARISYEEELVTSSYIRDTHTLRFYSALERLAKVDDD